MQRLYIKQRVFSVTERYTVTDGTGELRYQVSGSFMSIPKRFIITNVNGDQVAELEKKVFSFLPRFYVSVDGTRMASIVKEFSFLKPRYRIEAEGLSVRGDWWDMNFSVFCGGTQLAEIHQRWLSWGDSYEITVFDDAYETLVVALVIAIDKVKSDESAVSSAVSG